MGPLGIGWARMSRHVTTRSASFRIGPVLTERPFATVCFQAPETATEDGLGTVSEHRLDFLLALSCYSGRFILSRRALVARVVAQAAETVSILSHGRPSSRTS